MISPVPPAGNLPAGRGNCFTYRKKRLTTRWSAPGWSVVLTMHILSASCRSRYPPGPTPEKVTNANTDIALSGLSYLLHLFLHLHKQILIEVPSEIWIRINEQVPWIQLGDIRMICLIQISCFCIPLPNGVFWSQLLSPPIMNICPQKTRTFAHDIIHNIRNFA